MRMSSFRNFSGIGSVFKLYINGFERLFRLLKILEDGPDVHRSETSGKFGKIREEGDIGHGGFRRPPGWQNYIGLRVG